MNRMKKSVVTAGLTAGLIGGAAASVVFGTPLLVGAQEDSGIPTTVESTVAPETSTTETTPEKSDDKATKEKGGSDDKANDKKANDEADDTKAEDKSNRSADKLAKRNEWLQTTLKPLVEAGTITQAQADAVVKALAEAKPDRGDKGRPGWRGARGIFGGLDKLSDLLGLTPVEISKELADGKTLAQIAESKNVSPQKVIDTLVAQHKTRLDAAVKNGRIDQAEADERLAEATESITDGVNNGSLRGLLGRGPFGGRHGGD